MVWIVKCSENLEKLEIRADGSIHGKFEAEFRLSKVLKNEYNYIKQRRGILGKNRDMKENKET